MGFIVPLTARVTIARAERTCHVHSGRCLRCVCCLLSRCSGVGIKHTRARSFAHLRCFVVPVLFLMLRVHASVLVWLMCEHRLTEGWRLATRRLYPSQDHMLNTAKVDPEHPPSLDTFQSNSRNSDLGQCGLRQNTKMDVTSDQTNPVSHINLHTSTYIHFVCTSVYVGHVDHVHCPCRRSGQQDVRLFGGGWSMSAFASESLLLTQRPTMVVLSRSWLLSSPSWSLSLSPSM